MNSGARLRYKIFASFAIALAAIVGIVRLAAEAGVSTHVAGAYLIFALLAAAGIWRAVIYLRLARSATRG